MSDADKYPISMRLLHWLVAALVLAQVAVGLGMEDAADGREASTLHMSLGVTLLLLVALRLLVRMVSRVPPLPVGISRPERLAARA